MNGISSSPVYMATDGQTASKIQSSYASQQKKSVEKPLTPSGAQVAQDIANNIAEIKEDTKQLEKISQMISGPKVQFNVNKELNEVVIRVVDPSTNQVLKELPSKEIQELKLRMRKTMGIIFDRLV